MEGVRKRVAMLLWQLGVLGSVRAILDLPAVAETGRRRPRLPACRPHLQGVAPAREVRLARRCVPASWHALRQVQSPKHLDQIRVCASVAQVSPSVN